MLLVSILKRTYGFMVSKCFKQIFHSKKQLKLRKPTRGVCQSQPLRGRPSWWVGVPSWSPCWSTHITASTLGGGTSGGVAKHLEVTGSGIAKKIGWSSWSSKKRSIQSTWSGRGQDVSVAFVAGFIHGLESQMRILNNNHILKFSQIDLYQILSNCRLLEKVFQPW